MWQREFRVPYRTRCAEQCCERSKHHVFMDANAPNLLLAVSDPTLDKCRCLDVLSMSNGVLLVVHDVEVYAQRLEAVSQRRYGTVSDPLNDMLVSVDSDNAF